MYCKCCKQMYMKGIAYLMKGVVRDDPKLLDDNGKVLKANEVVGGSIPGCEIISLLDGKLGRWSSVSCVPNKNKNYVPMFKLV